MTRVVLHFALIGAALFAVDRGLLREPEAPHVPPPIVIPAERVEALRRTLWQRGGGEPTEAEIAAMVEAEVGDELLYREALALGFDRDDPVIFNRLVMNMRFAGSGEESEAEALYLEARELGMHLTDIVVRRRLIQRMRLLIEARAAKPPPTEDELRVHFAARSSELFRPARVRIVHRYFSRESTARAAAVLARLQGRGPDAGADLAEPFLHPPDQPSQSERELANRFGPEFARGVFALPPGAWGGPVPSAYGVHLVYVQERTERQPLAFEEVRDQMRYGVLADRGAEALTDVLAKLRDGVEVRIQPPKG